MAVTEALLKTAGPFEEADLEQIKSGFEALLKKKLDFTVVSDSALLGGFVAYIDNKVYDASVLTQLERLRDEG